MLWLICFLNYADRTAISAVLPVLKKEYGFSATELGFISSVFGLVYALTAPFAGPVADRYSRKFIILGGLAIWSAITGLTAACKSFLQFVFVRGAEGLGETFYFPASMSLVSDYHGPKTRSRAMSLHQTSVYAGTIGGSAITGWLAMKTGDWRVPFVLFAVAGILLGVLLARFIREPVRGESEQGDVPKVSMREFLIGLLRTPTALMLILAFLGANSVALVFLTWMPTFLKENFGLNLAAAGLGATVYIQLASMAGAAIGGVLADKARSKMPGGRILIQACGLAIGAPFILACGFTKDLWVLVGAMTVFGLGKGLYDSNIWASLYDCIPTSRRASAVGVMNMVGWTGGSVATVLVGVAVDSGATMGAAIASTAGIYVVSCAVLLVGAFRFAPRDIAWVPD